MPGHYSHFFSRSRGSLRTVVVSQVRLSFRCLFCALVYLRIRQLLNERIAFECKPRTRRIFDHKRCREGAMMTSQGLYIFCDYDCP